MHILGLILTILIYVILVASIVLFGVGIFQKKYNFAFFICKIMFLYALLSLAIESWSLILIAGGFNIYFNVGIDYTYTLFLLIPATALLIYGGVMIKRRIKFDNILEQIGIFLLPSTTIVAFGLATILLFFNITYFVCIY